MTWASSLESHFSVCLMLRNWLKPTVSYADVSTFDSLSPPPPQYGMCILSYRVCSAHTVKYCITIKNVSIYF